MCAHSTLSNVKLSDELPPLTQVSLDPPAYYLTAGVTYTGDLATAMAILGRSVTLVNGVIAPNYPMGVSDAHDGRMRGLRRVRVTGATVGDVVNVEFGGVADGQCGFWSVSRDGVFFETPRRVDGSLLVPPGGRVDVIMQVRRRGSVARRALLETRRKSAAGNAPLKTTG